MTETTPPWPHWLDRAPVGLIAVGSDGRIQAASTTAQSLLGICADDLTGRHRESLPPAERHLLDHPQTVVPLPANEQRPRRWLRTRIESEGDLTLHMLEDRTREAELTAERDSLAAEFEHGVNADRDTGLLNRAGLLMRLEPQLARCRRYGAQLGVVKITVSLPRDYNPTPTVAQLIHDQLRWADMAARLEPDTFVIALPETDIGGAWEMLRRLAGRLAVELGTVPVVAHGVAEWQPGDDTIGLLRRADAAMEAGGLDTAIQE